MERYYKRADDIDQKIHSVKLPYLTWKVLFLIGEKQSVADLKEYLNEDEKDVEEAVQNLLKQRLITQVEEVRKESEIKEKIAEEFPAENAPSKEIVEEEIEEEAGAEEEKIEREAEEKITAEEIAPEEEKPSVEEEAVPEETKAEEPDFFAEEEPDIVIGKEKEKKSEEEKEAPAAKEKEKSVFDLGEDLEESSVFEGVETEEEKPAEAPEAEIEIPEKEEVEKEEPFDLDIDFGIKEKQAEQPPAAEQGPPEVAEKVKTNEVTILVIDDSIVIRKMVELALEKEDYQIETAVTGKDGLKLLDQLQPNIVILDLMLPDINGIDLLKTIKASKGIPVIMLSGKDSPQMIEKARAEGADAFLPKPFRDEELVQTIKKLI